MQRIKNTAFSATAFAVFLAVLIFSLPVWAAGETALLIRVKHLGINPVEGSIKEHATFIVAEGNPLESERSAADVFLLWPERPLALQFFSVSGFSEQGVPLPGDIVSAFFVGKGEAYLLRHHVPEGMPNLIVCARDEKDTACWVPRFSGVDGSVELDPGFVLFTKN